MSVSIKSRSENSQKKFKKVICSQCGIEFEVPLSSNKKICDTCKKENIEKARYFSPRKCEICGKEFDYDWRRDAATRKGSELRFCSSKCARAYSSRQCTGKVKEVTCKICGRKTIADIHSVDHIICKECTRTKAVEKRKLLGHTTYQSSYYTGKYNYPESSVLGQFERSPLYQRKCKSLLKLGFDFQEPNIEKEFNRIRNILYNLYCEENLPACKIEKMFNLGANALTVHVLKAFDIPKRSSSEAISMSWMISKPPIQDTAKIKYKNGHHIDFLGKDHYLRSSYEFDFAEKLDFLKIPYETETIKVRYFNLEDNKEHTGVPDFYLPMFNVIVEVKSSYNYKFIDLNCRKNRLEELGYKYYVCLNKDYILEDLIDISNLKDSKLESIAHIDVDIFLDEIRIKKR